MDAKLYVLAIVAFSLPSNIAFAADDSWVMWEARDNYRPRPVETFSSKGACMASGRALITQFVRRVSNPNVTVEVAGGGLTAISKTKTKSTVQSGVPAATTAYRKALEKVLALHERELARHQDRLDQGAPSPSDLDKQRQLENNVADTRKAIAEADRLAEADRNPDVIVTTNVLNYQCWPVGVNP